MPTTPGITYTFSSSSRDRNGNALELSHGYRGFSTSFSHSFVHSYDEKGDTCSLACCGILQSERNEYLLSGKVPYNFPIRFAAYIVLPTFLFAIGMMYVCKEGRSHTEWIVGISLVSIVAIYICIQAYRKCIHQISLRREALKKKHAVHESTTLDGGVIENPYVEEAKYLMGQTSTDMYCAHAPCGCYQGDVDFEEAEAPLPDDLCDFMWQSYVACCCSYCLDRFFQFCGICGISQESREIDKMYPPHQRAFDYITMEPILDYYGAILELRHADDQGVLQHLMTISTLSLYLVQTFIIGFSAIALFYFLMGGWLKTLGEIAMTLVAANTFLWWFHFRFGTVILSADAVIKCFASGLYIASSMAIPFLIFVPLISEGLISTILKFWDDDYYTAYTNYGYGSSNLDDAFKSFLSPWFTENGLLLSKHYPFQFLAILFIQCYVAALIEEVVKYLAYRMVSDHPDFLTKTDLEKVLQRTKEELEKEGGTHLYSIADIRVESHVRPLRSRAMGNLIAMMSVSIGFASAEAILSTFFHQATAFTLLHVFSRLLLWTIHPLCAALQTEGICERCLELKPSFKLGLIIRPAVFFHGLFDFAVIVGDFLAENKVEESSLQILCHLVPPILVLWIGYLWATRSFGNLCRQLDTKSADTIDVRNTWNWHASKFKNPILLSIPKTYTNDAAYKGAARIQNPAVRSSHSENKKLAIATSKSLDEILEEIKAKKQATIYLPGSWEVQNTSASPPTSKYGPPNILSGNYDDAQNSSLL
jgi:hypothetical protein